MHLASGSHDGMLRLWDLSGTSFSTRVLDEHIGWVRALAFFPDGKRLASGSSDRTLRLWDFDPGPIPFAP